MERAMRLNPWHTLCLVFTFVIAVFTGGCAEESSSESQIDDVNKFDETAEFRGWTYDEVVQVVEQLKVDDFTVVEGMSPQERQGLIDAIEYFGIPHGPEGTVDVDGQKPAPPAWMPDCHYKDGRMIGFGQVPYDSGTNYSNIWSPNCYFYTKPAQCGNDDWVVSFWMNRDYRGQQSKLKAYSSHWWPRLYLWAWEGHYGVEIYKNDGNGQHSVYACWPKSLDSYMAHMQLKQMR
jgi:hypothetical protein